MIAKRSLGRSPAEERQRGAILLALTALVAPLHWPIDWAAAPSHGDKGGTPMRSRLRLSLTLVLALALTFVAPGAQAINIKNVMEAMGVYLGLGDIIAFEEVAVPQRFHRRANKFILYLTLTENQTSGVDILLGEQRRRLAGSTLVSPDGGPNGRAVYEAEWSGDRSTSPLEFGSSVTACTQLFRLDGRAASRLECRNLDPIF